MTRIGKVKLKYDNSKDYLPHCAPTVLQFVVENGEWKLAEFRFEKNVFWFDRSLLPGDMIHIAHQYRRTA